MEVEIHPFDLRQATQEVIDLLLPKAKQKVHDIVLDFKEGIQEYIFGDSMRIRQILHILVGNAIEFTERGTMTISVENKHEFKTTKDNAMVLISLTDTGIGLIRE